MSDLRILPRKERASRSCRTDSWEEDATDKECLEVGLLGAGRDDAFAGFPIASQPYTHVVIDHCEFEFEKEWIK